MWLKREREGERISSLIDNWTSLNENPLKRLWMVSAFSLKHSCYVVLMLPLNHLCLQNTKVPPRSFIPSWFLVFTFKTRVSLGEKRRGKRVRWKNGRLESQFFFFFFAKGKRQKVKKKFFFLASNERWGRQMQDALSSRKKVDKILWTSKLWKMKDLDSIIKSTTCKKYCLFGCLG